MTIETVIAILREILSQTRSDMLESEVCGMAENTPKVNLLAMTALHNYKCEDHRAFFMTTISCLDMAKDKRRQDVFNTLALWSARLERETTTLEALGVDLDYVYGR
jgi:hypothetical protein